jgi:hypothetical protein
VKRRFLLASLGLVLAYGVAQIAWGEAIESTGGLGFYDGRRYGEIAMDFHGQVFREGLDGYRLQRVLPSAIVHVWLRATGQPLDATHVRDAFRIYNLLMLLATAAAWAAIARTMAWEERYAWLGFALLFLNFANLKMPFYNAVLTDTTALALGTLLILFHLRSNGPALMAVLVFSAFTWPPLLAGALLYVLPRHDAAPPERLVTKTSALLGGLAAVTCAAVVAAYPDILVQRPRPWLTIAVLAVYYFLTQASLLHFDWRALPSRVRWWRVAHVAALMGAVRIIVAVLSPAARGFTIDRYLREIVFYTTLQPALFLVAHAVYFGIAVCLLIATWRHAARAAVTLGTGLTLYTALQLGQAIDPETRHLIPALPLLVLLVVRAARAIGWPAWAVAVTAAVNALGSKAWWPINQGEFGDYLEPPLQYYYMNHGGAMSPFSYRLQGTVVVVLLVATAAFVRSRRTRRPADSASATSA